MAAPVRFELTRNGVRVHCLTAWLWGKHTLILSLLRLNSNFYFAKSLNLLASGLSVEAILFELDAVSALETIPATVSNNL